MECAPPVSRSEKPFSLGDDIFGRRRRRRKNERNRHSLDFAIDAHVVITHWVHCAEFGDKKLIIGREIRLFKTIFFSRRNNGQVALSLLLFTRFKYATVNIVYIRYFWHPTGFASKQMKSDFIFEL